MEPIAKRLKQSAESALHVTTMEKQETNNLDERIRCLEADLQRGSTGDSSGLDSDSDSDEDRTKAVWKLSAYTLERIAPLPDAMLPVARPSSVLPSAKKQRDKTQQEHNQQAANQALELLTDALTFPKKIPFACKPCKYVGKNIKDFQAHRVSREHREQVRTGEKALHCVLCKKSFTSQTQVDEHRAGKWHKQRVQQKKERHVVKVCYDFVRGECKRGDRCYFQHTETKAMRSGRAGDTKTRSRVCSNLARGQNCRFGDQCLFSHDAI